MGAGRKTQTFCPGDSISWPHLPGDGSTLSRKNLRKSDLGGVIFGCKHNTMQECLSKQLFGLPHGHFSYVRNIGEGLPLFLFNYSDRKLHGIYEAASNGHMSFDAYAWTDGGTERTPFPAQVYISIKMQCQPLTENQFRKVIMDNYFTPQHFWFELDHAQTRGLLALFKPSSSSDILPTPCRKELYPALVDKTGVPSNKKELFTALPATKRKPILRNEVDECKSSSVHINGGDVGYSSSNKTSCTRFEDTDSKDRVSDWEDLAEDNACNVSVGANLKVDGMDHTSEKQQSDTEGLEKEEERVLRLIQKLAADRELLKSSSSGGNSTGPDCNHESAEDARISKLPEVNYAKGEDEDISTMSDISHTNAELVQIIEELKERTSNLEKQRAEQDREINQLRNAFKDAGTEIQFLNDCVKGLSKVISLDDSREKNVAQYFSPDDVIYLIGGFDGYSWLSALDSFTPALDIVKPLQSMSFARSYASTVSLDGVIYVFGGGDGYLWFDSVECFNRTYDKWTSCPSMLREKGSLAGAGLDGKIFVIGGGNGVECFSDVEMFDPAAGIWIKNQPLIHTRFAPAAAELNGVIYAIGGYDGNAYLRSVERLDPREGTWAEAPKMNIRRSDQSVAVFNEKLYCMGGYNGEKMVSSLEIFDPRLDSWVMGEPMKSERGFAAVAVLGDSLLAMGGVKDDKVIVDMVECYRERDGWSPSGLKAIGKRCFCSAIVL